MLRLRPLSSLLLLTVLAGCASGPPLRVVNWNTYHAFDHGRTVAEASGWLADQAPSIVALQELVQTTEEELERLAASWGHAHAALHKESGYAVGLTSAEPIEVLERRVEGYHHGYLRVRTQGLELFVVHFWPGKVHEAEEVAALAAEAAQDGTPVIVLGDFNGEVRSDEPWLREQGTLGELVNGVRQFDYRITDAFLERGFSDAIHEHDPRARYTFGSPALIPRWSPDMASVEGKRRRIDFVFTSSAVTARVLGARVERDDATVGQWSDHYPLLVDLSRP